MGLCHLIVGYFISKAWMLLLMCFLYVIKVKSIVVCRAASVKNIVDAQIKADATWKQIHTSTKLNLVGVSSVQIMYWFTISCTLLLCVIVSLWKWFCKKWVKMEVLFFFFLLHSSSFDVAYIAYSTLGTVVYLEGVLRSGYVRHIFTSMFYGRQSVNESSSYPVSFQCTVKIACSVVISIKQHQFGQHMNKLFLDSVHAFICNDESIMHLWIRLNVFVVWVCFVEIYMSQAALMLYNSWMCTQIFMFMFRFVPADTESATHCSLPVCDIWGFISCVCVCAQLLKISL